MHAEDPGLFEVPTAEHPASMLDVQCTTCGAWIGGPCHSLSHRKYARRPHKARRDLWLTTVTITVTPL